MPLNKFSPKILFPLLQGMIIGHEFVGVIENMKPHASTGESPTTGKEECKIGNRVVGEINVACETCDVCEKGGIAKRNHCPNRQVLGIINKNGTFAEYITLPISNLFQVPDNLTDQQAVFAEPLAAAFRIVEQTSFLPTDKVCVIGDGKLGLLISEVLHSQNIQKLTVFGHHDDKMALLPVGIEKMLSDETTSQKYENQFDVCVDACGTLAGLTLAGKLTRPLGTIFLKTTCAENVSPFNPFEFVVKEQIIIGSRCGNFKMALDALSSGKVNVDKLVSGVYPLNEGEEAFKMAAKKGTMKVQIIVSEN